MTLMYKACFSLATFVIFAFMWSQTKRTSKPINSISFLQYKYGSMQKQSQEKMSFISIVAPLSLQQKGLTWRDCRDYDVRSIFKNAYFLKKKKYWNWTKA